jgi:hypothetical protein
MNYPKEVLEKAKMAVEIGNAILQGKKVIYSDKGKNGYFRVDNPSLDFTKYDYIVKPETQYIPFTFEDAKDLIGKVVVDKHSIATIDYLDANGCNVSMTSWTYEEMLERYTFLDGTPCGKLVNE